MSEKETTGIDKLSYTRKINFVLGSLRYSAQSLFDKSKATKPRHLVNIVTWRCNGNCVMCNISRLQDSTKTITLDEYEDMLSDKPFWSSLSTMNVTGGEPFLRKDLIDLILLWQDKCKNLQEIDISTNGFLTKKITGFVKEVVPSLRLNVGISVSLDGVGETHDRIRGVRGAFKKTSKTIFALKKLEKQHDNLLLTTQCVVSQMNINHMQELQRFCNANGLPSSLTVASFQDPFYKNIDKRHLGLTDEQVKGLFTRNHFIDYYTHKQIEKKKRFLPCDAGSGTFSINPYADVYFCNNLPKVGNLREKAIREIWYSKKAAEIRNIIKKGDICKHCFFSCDLASAVQKNFKLLLKFGTVRYLLKLGILKI